MKTIDGSKTDIKTLFVCSGNGNNISPFILDQKNALEARGVAVDLFPIQGKGIMGYLKSLKSLASRISSRSYDFIHAHYGLSGLLSTLQRKIPVIITLHGSDVNNPKVRIFSRIAAFLSRKVIVVSKKMRSLLKAKHTQVEVIPCGVDMNLFYPVDMQEARKKLASNNKFLFKDTKKYILFSSAFDMDVKNPELAKKSVKALEEEYELIELKGFTRQEVALMLNAVDVALMTSRTEGSPQFIKEAMACNCPVVTTDVGDVRTIINNTEGCFISPSTVEDIAGKIKNATDFGITTGRCSMPGDYKEKEVVDQIIESYEEVVEEQKD